MTKTHWNDRIVAGEMLYCYWNAPIEFFFEPLTGWPSSNGVVINVFWQCPLGVFGWDTREGDEY
jgi:hypothetical protein